MIDGLRERGSLSAGDVLRGALRAMQLLLVLDNCEHVADAAPEIAALLQACAGLVTLATSRTALHLQGERVYPVAPPALPTPGRLLSAGSPAV